MVTPDIRKRIEKIRFAIFDIDGVLTDGRIVYDNEGNELKFFDVQDGFGIHLLQLMGIECGIMTAKRSKIVEKRAKDFKVKVLYMDCIDKLACFEDLLEKHKFKPEEISFMGDDLIDLPVLKRVGFAISVPNGVEETRKAAHYITKKPGGRGAVREVCDLILKTQNKWPSLITKFDR